MKKINYALIGILIAAIIYGVLYSSIPKVLVPDVDKNEAYLDNLEIDDYVDLSNVITMIGYQLYSQDIDNRLASNIFAYGRNNPMYFIKVSLPEIKKEHEEATSGGTSDTYDDGASRRQRYYVYPYSGGEYFSQSKEKNLGTYIKDYNLQFSLSNMSRVLGYNKLTTELEVLDLGTLFEKIKRDARLPVDQQYLAISSKFGARVDPFNYSVGSQNLDETAKLLPFHTGLDLSYSGINGSNVYSMLDGTIKRISKGNTGYGNLVVIDHGGFETYYAHMSEIRGDLREGSFVIGGEKIGNVGSTGRSTGPHLHLEFVFNNVAINPELFIPSNLFKVVPNPNLKPTGGSFNEVRIKLIEDENKETKEETEEAKDDKIESQPVKKESQPKTKTSPPVKKPKKTYQPPKTRPKSNSSTNNSNTNNKLEDKKPVEDKKEDVKLEPLPELDKQWRNE